MLAIRNILFVLLVPGTVTVLIPWLIAGRNRAAQFSHSTPWRHAGLLPLLIGVIILAWCVWDFIVIGQGTPAPIDPPTQLVARGPYRHVRNPMYVAVALILLGEAALFASLALLIYTAIFFAAAHCFVVFYEEPGLHRRFGESYDAYRRRVRRWIPRVRG
ncbi:MAG TPA: methyltransferase [Verrucomicrobiae bacterium]|nr:methyltransferase [Verrucomicrobiae bacterium]